MQVSPFQLTQTDSLLPNGPPLGPVVLHDPEQLGLLLGVLGQAVQDQGADPIALSDILLTTCKIRVDILVD